MCIGNIDKMKNTMAIMDLTDRRRDMQYTAC